MNKLFFVLLVPIIFIIGMSGCSSHRTVASRSGIVPLTKEFPDLQARAANASVEQKNDLRLEIADTLSLRDALSLALMYNPELSVFSFETRIREAEAIQASLLPNPEIDAEIENFAGSGAFDGFQESELTVTIGQLLELGNKRQKRTQVAVLGADMAAWNYEVVRLDVFTRVVKAFIDELVIQQRIDLQKELVKVAEEFLQNIEQRVNAGRLSPAEIARAKVEFLTTTIEMNRLKKELQAATKRLAATWGSTEPKFKRVTGKLDTKLILPSFEKLQALISQNPDIARWAVAIQQREAELAFEKSQRIPDLTISGGFRRLNESGDNAFVMGLSMPMLLFDHNQGNIQAAEYRRKQVEQQKRAVEVSINTSLSESYTKLSQAYNEALILKTNVIVEAKNAFDMISHGYQMGKFGSLDVLDAQRTLFEVRARYLDALKEYHQSSADLERLVGKKISDLQ